MISAGCNNSSNFVLNYITILMYIFFRSLGFGHESLSFVGQFGIATTAILPNIGLKQLVITKIDDSCFLQLLRSKYYFHMPLQRN